MKVLKAWVEALGIDQNTFSSWVQEAPKHENLTFWCLERGRLRSSDYYDWAMNHYGLAMLTEGYFSQSANRELWQKIQSVANWSPHMLPLEEWDGTVFVACVEPPDDIQWSFPVQYVLATTRDLRMHWERLNSESTRVSQSITNVKSVTSVTKPGIVTKPGVVIKAATPPPPVPPPIPQAKKQTGTSPLINTSVTQKDTPLNLMPQPTIVAEEVAAPVIQAPPPPPSLSEQDEMPEGLALNLKLDDDKHLNLDKTENVEAPIGLEAPAGFKLNLGGDLKTLDDQPAGIVAKMATPTEKLSLAPEGLAPKPIAPPVINTPAPKPVTASLPNLAVPVSTPAPASSGHGSIDSDRIAPKTLTASSSELETIAWGFQQLKQHFKYSWLFLVSGDQLNAHCWDASIKPSNSEATQSIDINQPSLFRIVVRTRMPYHGHVVESPINTGFFKNWGLRQTPPHVTAIPLASGGHMVAVLMCAGDKPAQLDQVLRFAEKTGNTILTNLGKKQAAA
ncbi:MAG: hypothetical protein AB7N80_12405 [Bdellovibrionales bacterium]